MKINCTCGHRISDNSDNHRHKGYFVADQDYYDGMMNSVDNLIDEVARVSSSDMPESIRLELFNQIHIGVRRKISFYTRIMYQCPNCGRMLLDDTDGNLHIYSPQDDNQSRNILASVKNENWRGGLRGLWAQKRGTDIWFGFLSWNTSVSEGWKAFDNWDNLEKEYYELFNELITQNVLLHSNLHKLHYEGGAYQTTIHKYDANTDES